METEEELLMKLTAELADLQAGIDNLDLTDASLVQRELNEMRKDIQETRQEMLPAKKRHITPDIDKANNEQGKPTRRFIDPSEPLFETPATDEERFKKGRVKYVTKEEEKIAYPLPWEIVDKEPKTIIASSIFVNTKPGEFADLRQGNMTFESVPFPAKGDPLLKLI